MCVWIFILTLEKLLAFTAKWFENKYHLQTYHKDTTIFNTFKRLTFNTSASIVMVLDFSYITSITKFFLVSIVWRWRLLANYSRNYLGFVYFFSRHLNKKSKESNHVIKHIRYLKHNACYEWFFVKTDTTGYH